MALVKITMHSFIKETTLISCSIHTQHLWKYMTRIGDGQNELIIGTYKRTDKTLVSD